MKLNKLMALERAKKRTTVHAGWLPLVSRISYIDVTFPSNRLRIMKILALNRSFKIKVVR